MVVWIVVAAVVVVLFLFAIVTYNHLVRLRNEAETGWANIDVQLKRRADLVPNLVEAVRAYAAHEAETFDSVTKARAAAQQAAGPAQAAQADAALSGSLNRLIAVSEAYPQLRASENFLKLQQELADIEDKLAAARRYYNQTVYRFNSVQQTFPSVLVARPFGFHERQFFETDQRDARERQLRRNVTLKEQIRANRWRTLWLLFLFAVLVGVIGVILAYAFRPSLLIVVGIVGIVYGIFSWISAGKIVASATGAQPADRAQYPRLYHVVETVALAAGLTQPPPIYIVDDAAPNAFAAGRSLDTAYVCVTTGLLDLMDERELEGVIAHELSHIRNRDVRLMSLVAVLVGVVALLSDFLFRVSIFGGGRKSGGTAGLIAFALGLAALALAPIAAVLIQLAVSRRREYLADASAAEITGDGEGLALALRKLELDTTETRHASRAVAHLYIENPLNQASGMRRTMRSLFDTHPPLTARIAALEEAGGFKLPPA